VPGSTLLYGGIVAIVGGIGWLIVGWFRRRSGWRNRARRAGIVAGLGVALMIAGYFLPAPERRVAQPMTRLDAFVPAWQFGEFHEVRVNASPARVYAAIESVRAEDIALFQTLTWIRRLGRPAPESILAPSPRRPIIEVATTSGFLRLATEPAREILLGIVIVVDPHERALKAAALRRPETFTPPHLPGLCLVGMNFLIRPHGVGGSVLSTETRVFATDAAAHRAFATYWRTIYPGSAIIRRMWLRAIRQRAEQP
jgi:hypothetical protein